MSILVLQKTCKANNNYKNQNATSMILKWGGATQINRWTESVHKKKFWTGCFINLNFLTPYNTVMRISELIITVHKLPNVSEDTGDNNFMRFSSL